MPCQVLSCRVVQGAEEGEGRGDVEGPPAHLSTHLPEGGEAISSFHMVIDVNEESVIISSEV